MKTEAFFLGDTFEIHTIRNRPWVSVRLLCDRLGIVYATQAKRLRRHRSTHGLDLAVIEPAGIHLPLDELSWWLRTLRPASDSARKTLARYKGALALHLLHEWSVTSDGYTRAHDTRRQARQRAKQARKSPPRRKTKITRTMASEMKRMHESPGMSYRAIGDHFGYSASTVCLVVNDKYPVALK